MVYGYIPLRLMAHGPLKVHHVSDTPPLTYFADVVPFVQIADDYPDAALRDTHLPRNLPGGDPRIFGHQRQNRRVICDKGPLLFVPTITTAFFAVNIGHRTSHLFT